MNTRWICRCATLVVLGGVACGGSHPTAPSPTPGTTLPAGHVVVVVEENTDYHDVIGNPAMPYLNGLASQYSLATEYYANTHPSIGNYFMLVTGAVVTNDDQYSGVTSVDNIVRQLRRSGRTWKSYAEDLPSVGYTGGSVGSYARRHNVFAHLSDVVNDPAEVVNLVPFTQFQSDMVTGKLPNYSFVVPNLCHDGHDCPPSTVDAWLQANIGPLFASSQFQQDGLLIVTYDEASDADVRNGGGHIVWVGAGPRARRGYRSANTYQHPSTLRLVVETLGLGAFPNQAGSAPSMSEFLIY